LTFFEADFRRPAARFAGFRLAFVTGAAAGAFTRGASLGGMTATATGFPGTLEGSPDRLNPHILSVNSVQAAKGLMSAGSGFCRLRSIDSPGEKMSVRHALPA
jgi:hypothetical protein